VVGAHNVYARYNHFNGDPVTGLNIRAFNFGYFLPVGRLSRLSFDYQFKNHRAHRPYPVRGTSVRTNSEGIRQLAEELSPFGYDVKAVEVRGCMHLKTGCTYLGGRSLLANRAWIDAGAFADFEIVDVAPAGRQPPAPDHEADRAGRARAE
jgi:hypothetical protein